jgi:large conductance mechanosensitive channel
LKKILSEFKAFIAKGSVIDLAVGVIIGAAFKAIVDSLVGDIISPVIGLIADTNFTDLVWHVGGVSIRYGSFITAIINFLLMALVLFLLVKAINATRTIGGKFRRGEPEAPAARTEKQCPYCKKEIAIDATRCPHCTSEVP